MVLNDNLCECGRPVFIVKFCRPMWSLVIAVVIVAIVALVLLVLLTGEVVRWLL